MSPISVADWIATQDHYRFWWHQIPGNDYEPLCYAVLSDEEKSLMISWFEATADHYVGECSVPMASLIAGLVGGNGTSRVVQLGHYSGYSTLLTGFLLKRMGRRKALISFDIDEEVTAFTQTWIDRAGLADVVRLELLDSADPQAVARATAYFDGADPQVVFIDSSHQYAHTLLEYRNWQPALAPGGMFIMHDVSRQATAYDSTSAGGVMRAALELRSMGAPTPLLINSEVGPGGHIAEDLSVLADWAYQDGCGVGLLQKPY
ncbi:MAG: class I SAM-dependent methyltransferase [Candidatus Nanopelagicales bacterium]